MSEVINLKNSMNTNSAIAIDFETCTCSVCKFYHNDRCYYNPPDLAGNRPKVNPANRVCGHAIRTKSSTDFILGKIK